MLLQKTIIQNLLQKYLTTKPHFFCSTLRLLKDDDVLSQTDINSILGNENIELVQENKAKEIVTRDMFYGLVPTKNEKYPQCIDPNEEYILDTPNQNIMNRLGITVENSYDEYCNKLNTFCREDELYGTIGQLQKILPEQLPFLNILTPESKYLEQLRSNFVVNLSMPGSIQAQDPRNFMQLRPVQEFRNTPIIPIADSTMKKHKQKLQEYHRRQFIFEISKESIVSFSMFAITAGICIYMIYIILMKQQERTVAYTRFKYNRKNGIQENSPTFKI